MDSQTLNIVLFAIATYNGVLTAVIAYIIKAQNRAFEKLEENKDKCKALIDDNAKQDRKDRDELEKKITNLLDDHYVTSGQLTTLEERLMGEIKGLTMSIQSLTQAINNKL